MIRVWAFALSRLRGDRGATMVEYALILITIVIVVLAAALVLGPITNGKFVDVDTCINDATTC